MLELVKYMTESRRGLLGWLKCKAVFETVYKSQGITNWHYRVTVMNLWTKHRVDNFVSREYCGKKVYIDYFTS